MIALLAAAAVAASSPHLTESQVSKALDENPSMTLYHKATDDPCFQAKMALEIAGTLQTEYDERQLQVWSPDLIQVIDPGSHGFHLYKLDDASLNVVLVRLHQMQNAYKSHMLECYG